LRIRRHRDSSCHGVVETVRPLPPVVNDLPAHSTTSSPPSGTTAPPREARRLPR
jgi:hypothetical protein